MKNEETKEPFWKRRYTITLHGFVAFFLLNGHRLNLSVAMVAMVDYSDPENHTINQISNASAKIMSGLSHEQHTMRYNWSPKIQGGILGAGFAGYVLFLIVGGILSEAFGPRIILIIGTFVSSLSMMVTPFTASISPYFTMFIQGVRGIAQGLMFPAMTVLFVNWFPKAERGLLCGLAMSGFILGLLLAGILSSLICDSVVIGGWPVVFYTFGGFGVFASMLQGFFLSDIPKDDPRISSAELKYILANQENELTTKRPDVPWRRILCSMPTYALFLGTFGQFWICTYFVSVHPIFLATILHLPMQQNGIMVSVPYVLSMFCNVSSSLLSSFFEVKKYCSVSRLRKSWHIFGCLLYSLCLLAMILTSCESRVTIICSVIGMAVMGFSNSGIMIVALDMTPTFAGSLNALSSTLGSISGVILPVVCGILTNEEQTVQQWNKFFIISIAIVMSTAIFYCIFGSSEIQSYNLVDEDVSPNAKEESKNDSKPDELRETFKFSNHI